MLILILALRYFDIFYNIVGVDRNFFETEGGKICFLEIPMYVWTNLLSFRLPKWPLREPQ